MNELVKLAKIAGLGTASEVALKNRLGGNLGKRDAFRRAILKRATAEERRIADFARDYSGSDFRVLCNLAARHEESAA